MESQWCFYMHFPDDFECLYFVCFLVIYIPVLKADKFIRAFMDWVD